MIIPFRLFTFIINAFLRYIADRVIDDFEIKDGLSTLVDAGIHMLSTQVKLASPGIKIWLYPIPPCCFGPVFLSCPPSPEAMQCDG